MDASSEPELYLLDQRAFEGKAIGEKVQELIDREEIREIIAIYAHRVAHACSVADLFTDDGLYVVRFPGRPPAIVEGGSNLKSHFSAGLEVLGDLERPLPMIHNLLLKIQGDEASGICSNELRMTEDGQSMIGSGYYRDQYRRVNGRWRFAVRDMTFIHWVPLYPGWTGSEPKA